VQEEEAAAKKKAEAEEKEAATKKKAEEETKKKTEEAAAACDEVTWTGGVTVHEMWSRTVVCSENRFSLLLKKKIKLNLFSEHTTVRDPFREP